LADVFINKMTRCLKVDLVMRISHTICSN